MSFLQLLKILLVERSEQQEDGDYTDGLYTDFTTSTAIGTAIDRFNEILKGFSIAPPPQATAVSPINL